MPGSAAGQPDRRLLYPRTSRLPDYTFKTMGQQLQDMRRSGVDVIDLGMGNPSFEPPPQVVAKLGEAATREGVHRYAASRGVERLRKAICQWYAEGYGVALDYNANAVITHGSKEAIGQLMMAFAGPEDEVYVPSPTYPVHLWGVRLADAALCELPGHDADEFLRLVDERACQTARNPRILVLNYPANPTTQCVELEFFRRAVAVARKHGMMIIQDLAYADLVFDRDKAPSILEIPEARDIAVETFSMSKSYSMAGWRIGFVCGSEEIIEGLARFKSYMDYGMHTPPQIAAVIALEECADYVADIREQYRNRRDVLCQQLKNAGWEVATPQATMYVWGRIPEDLAGISCAQFTSELLQTGHTMASAGAGFGKYGEGYIRFSLIANEHRIRQAGKGIGRTLACLREKQQVWQAQ